MADEIDALNGPKVKALRKRVGLNQEAFWGNIGCSLQQGSSFERGITKQDDRPLKLMIWLHYELGLNTQVPDTMRQTMDYAEIGRRATRCLSHTQEAS